MTSINNLVQRYFPFSFTCQTDWIIGFGWQQKRIYWLFHQNFKRNDLWNAIRMMKKVSDEIYPKAYLKPWNKNLQSNRWQGRYFPWPKMRDAPPVSPWENISVFLFITITICCWSAIFSRDWRENFLNFIEEFKCYHRHCSDCPTVKIICRGSPIDYCWHILLTPNEIRRHSR